MSQSFVEEHCNFNSSINISDQHARKREGEGEAGKGGTVIEIKMVLNV